MQILFHVNIVIENILSNFKKKRFPQIIYDSVTSLVRDEL